MGEPHKRNAALARGGASGTRCGVSASDIKSTSSGQGSRRPWFKFYAADHIADTVGLSVDQHGAYLILLLLAWRRPDSALPDDMKALKQSFTNLGSGLHGSRFNSLVPPLLRRFFILKADGNWHHHRLDFERESAESLSTVRRESANSRWSRPYKNKHLPDAKAGDQIRSDQIRKKDGIQEDGGNVVALHKPQHPEPEPTQEEKEKAAAAAFALTSAMRANASKLAAVHRPPRRWKA
jgi:uncharacterized protein YdaU (DUF1376 family)